MKGVCGGAESTRRERGPVTAWNVLCGRGDAEGLTFQKTRKGGLAGEETEQGNARGREEILQICRRERG